MTEQTAPGPALAVPLAQLDETGTKLALQLLAAAEAWRQHKQLPPTTLPAALLEFQQAFAALSAEVRAQAAQAALDFPPSFDSLRQLEDVLAQLAAQDGVRQRQAALDLLAHVLAYEHSATPDCEALRACQQAAAVCQAELAEEQTAALVQALLAGQHPLAQLVRLNEERQRLSDAENGLLYLSVMQAYGAELAAAAMLGRLRPRAPVPDRPPAPEDGPEAEAVPTPSLEPSLPNETVLPDQHVPPAQSAEAAPALHAPELPLPTTRLLEAAIPAINLPVSLPETPAPVLEAPPAHVVKTEAPAPVIRLLPLPAPRGALGATPLAPPSLLPSVAAAEAALEEAPAVEAPAGLAAPRQPWPVAEDAPARWHSLLWQLLAQARLGPAYHLAQAVAEDFPAEQSLPPWLVRALALSPHLRRASGELALLLTADFSQFKETLFTPGEDEAQEIRNQTLRLLCIAATLRPALLAPETGAAEVLSQLYTTPGLQALYEYYEPVWEFAQLHQPLDLQAFKEVVHQTDWETELARLQSQIEPWRVKVRALNLFGQTDKCWKEWNAAGNWLHKLLQAVLDNDLSQLEPCRMQLAELYNRQLNEWELTRQLNLTNRALNGNRAVRLVGRGQSVPQILRYTGEALGFVKAWVALHEQRASQAGKEWQQRSVELRYQLQARQATAEAALRDFAAVHPAHLTLQVAVQFCQRALANLAQLLDPQQPLSNSEPTARMLLHGELWSVSDLPLDPQWEPEAPAWLRRQALAELAEKPSADWADVFRGRLQQQDHAATAALLEYFDRYPEAAPGLDLAELRRQRETHLQRCKAAMQRCLAQARRAIEGAVSAGWLKEQERSEQITRLAQLEHSLPDTLRFGPAHDTLAQVHLLITSRRTAETAAVRRRLEDELANTQHPHHQVLQAAAARIDEVLQRDDALTANDYLDAALRGEALPEAAPAVTAFQQFFPGTLSQLVTYCAQAEAGQGPHWLPRQLREAKPETEISFGPLRFAGLMPAQWSEAAQGLEAWFATRQASSLTQERLRDILNAVGFDVLHLKTLHSGRRLLFECQTEPSPPKVSPVPLYGSAARHTTLEPAADYNRYLVRCVWDAPAAEQLLNDLESLPDQFPEVPSGPLLVCYFGILDEVARRELAHACRQQRRTCLVLDDLLLLYLSTGVGEVKEERLRRFFACTLPFTWLNPYTATPSFVPPEMFYGRRHELERLRQPQETSYFIFGGKQLGKTSLLHEVERRYHIKGKQEVLFFDVREQTPDYLWRELETRLKKQGIVPQTVRSHSGRSKLFEAVEEWLSKDPERRLMLLIDEADRLLEIDSQVQFTQIAELHRLVEQTQRRVKIVLVGLHNVLRASRGSNPALAHFGDPLCIGPLLNAGEARQARALIVEPLASLGYEFASADLVTHILSQTNYYPSLIQLYCRYLCEHLADTAFDRRSSPPYQITARHLDEVFSEEKLRDAIRDRFQRTLELDKRYDVIAHTIAYLSTPAAAMGTNSFTLATIREWALLHWEIGFRGEVNEHAFRILLEEMIGLGVLSVSEHYGTAETAHAPAAASAPGWRAPGERRYALRSPNVAYLLGTAEQIAAKLEACQHYEAEIPYEASSFRAADPANAALRSPLSAAQEQELTKPRNGVTVLYGCGAAQIEEVSRFLKARFGAELVLSLRSLATLEQFQAPLQQLSKRKDDSTTILLVESSCTWDSAWLEDAFTRLQEFFAENKFAQVVFMADPARAWEWLSQTNPEQVEAWQARGLTVLNLTTWQDTVVREWLAANEMPSDKEGRSLLHETTGNWPLLLAEFYQQWQSAQALGQTPDWLELLAPLESQLQNPPHAWLAAFGLHFPGPWPVLHALAHTEITEQLALEETLSAELVETTLRWLEALSLAAPLGGGRWRLDAIVRRLLNAYSNTALAWSASAGEEAG